MKSAKYLEVAKEKLGLKNDTALAEKLGRTKAAISQYMSGKSIMDNETCVKLAMELGIDPLDIIMAADMDRAERSGQHSMWEIFMERAKAAAASVLFATVIVTNFLTPSPAEAAPVLKNGADTLYIM